MFRWSLGVLTKILLGRNIDVPGVGATLGQQQNERHQGEG
jgi:hypothetical protein